MTTQSEHDYTARVVDPGGDIVLSNAETGTAGVDFDASRIPYVQGTLTVAIEDAMLLEQLDPRDTRRIIIEVDAALPGGSRSRTFDLGLRRTRPDRAGGTATLELASDEALLGDFAPLDDDRTPRTYETSLRAMTNYVLDQIGAALEPGPEDANVTAYWAVTNLLLNPSVEGTINNWSAAGNCSVFLATAPRTGANSCGFQSTAAGVLAVSPMLLSGKLSVSPGKSYVLDGYGMRHTAFPAGATMRAVIRWVDANGGSPWPDLIGAPIALGTVFGPRAVVIGTAPAGAVAAFPYFRVTGATAATQFGYIDDAMFHEGNEAIPFFTGATADTPQYDYAWAQDANASTSSRTPVVERSPELHIWRAGVSGMNFLEPLLKVAGLRLVCDELRQWTLRDADYRADGNQIYRHAGNIETADEELSREEGEWFDAAVYVYVWTDDDGIEQRRVDAYSAAVDPTKVLHVELNTPYPGPGRAQHIVERAQGRGRTVTVSAIPTWLEQTDQSLSILLEGTPIQTGIAGSVAYDFTADTVTVTSRTTDTPAAAWILIAVDERWIDSPPGESWTEEII